MKRLFVICGCLAAVMFSLSGCFKPEVTNDEGSDLLLGYWEVVHVMDDDEWYYIEDGERSETYTWNLDSDISCGDGNEEYGVYLFTGSMITLIATDDPSSAELLGLSFPYNRSGNKLYGAPFEGEYIKYYIIEKLDEDELVIYQEESGNSDGCYEWLKRRITLRRIKE